jgi:beta-aspartyl-peptidase (threonine type)
MVNSMRYSHITAVLTRLFFGLLLLHFSCQTYPQPRPKIVLVIHGGAGGNLKKEMGQGQEEDYRAGLREALEAGYQVLRKGGSSLDAVETSIRFLEDSPLFNAGKGAVFTSQGTNELDASIMDGQTLMAGAVAGVRRIKNPISLARLVMTRSPHVLLAGDGAEAFAKQQGIELVDPKYFFTERRWQELQKAKEAEQPKTSSESPRGELLRSVPQVSKYGTVGAVALDGAGNLAAGTSTGGMTNKRPGRIGDSPIIGAGTYANNHTCAVSATGRGEYFIRLAVAHDISALMEYKGLSLNEAASRVIEKVTKLGGEGGVIALDRNGNIATPYNTPGMFRAYVGPDGKVVVKIFQE